MNLIQIVMDEIIVWIKNGKFPQKNYDWME
jgi:hypothetical protein